MNKYTYTNPTPTWFTVNGENIFLEAGKAYDLPSNNAYIASLIEQGILVPVQEPKTTKIKRT